MQKSILSLLVLASISCELFSDITKAEQKVTMSMSSKVISDPINGEVNPKAIPGAKIAFRIKVDNNTNSSIQNAKVSELYQSDKYEYEFKKLLVKLNKKKTQMSIYLGALKAKTKTIIEYYAVLK